MTGFELAFADGERAAFEDKKAGRRQRIKPQGEMNPYRTAWWLGYTPRTLSWALAARPHKPPAEVDSELREEIGHRVPAFSQDEPRLIKNPRPEVVIPPLPALVFKPFSLEVTA